MMTQRVRSEYSIVFAMLKQNKAALFGLFIVIGFLFTALFGPFLTTHSPNVINLKNRLSAPSWEHPLGTDELGRDIFSRILCGAKISLQIGIIVVSISATIGIMIGVISGYYGGKTDAVIMRIVDIFLSFPSLILAIALMAALGQNIYNVMLALSLVGWTIYARVVRSEALQIREMEYIQAAKAMGASNFQIIFTHVLPNIIAPVIVLATLGMAFAIISEAGLSFIGLGVKPPTPSWGFMLSSGRMYMTTSPYGALFPGLAIALVVLGFNLIGDGLRDALDPELRI